ncbi:hypothetical protein BH18ACI4_BH18ACI4_02040 [soil metagenome]
MFIAREPIPERRMIFVMFRSINISLLRSEELCCGFGGSSYRGQNELGPILATSASARVEPSN